MDLLIWEPHCHWCPGNGNHWRLWSRGLASGMNCLILAGSLHWEQAQGVNDRSGKTTWEAIAAIQGRRDGILYQAGIKEVLRRCQILDILLKGEPNRFADRWDMDGEQEWRQRCLWGFDLSSWAIGRPCAERGKAMRGAGFGGGPGVQFWTN